jgi:hypothetical protein
MFTVNSSAAPPGARAGLLGSPVIETVRPAWRAVAAPDVAAGTTVTAAVAAGLVAVAGAWVPACDAVPPDEQPATTNASAQNEPKAAAARRYDIGVLPNQTTAVRHRRGPPGRGSRR